MNNEQLVSNLRDKYNLWNESKGASTEEWLELMADDIEWKSIGDGVPGIEFSRAANGKAEVARYFEELSNDWEMLHYHVDDIISERDRVVTIGHCAWRHRRNHKEVETPKIDTLRLKDGLVVEFFEFYDTAKVIAAAT